MKYEYDNEEYTISYDKDRLEKLMNELIEEESIKEHLTYCSPHYNYHQGEKKSNKYITKNYHEEAIPWIDVWDYYIYEYDKYTIPYLARLIKSALNGSVKAFEEIYFPVYEREYAPLLEVIKDGIKDIEDNNQDKIVNPCLQNWFPNARINVDRLKERRTTIKQCGEQLQNQEYINKFKSYYQEAKSMLEMKKVNKSKNLKKEK